MDGPTTRRILESEQSQRPPPPTFESIWNDWVIRYNRRGFFISLVFAWIGVGLSAVYEFNTAPEEIAGTLAGIRAVYLLCTLPAVAIAFVPKLFSRLHFIIPFIFLLGMQANTVFVCLNWAGISSPYFADYALTMLLATVLFVWPTKLVMFAYPLFVALYVGILVPQASPEEMKEAQAAVFFVATSGLFAMVMHWVRHKDAVERTRAISELATLRDAAEVDKIEIQRMSLELEKLALMDSLTLIANRRGFDQEMDVAWREHKGNDQPVSVIFCDVDHFKLFNDTYGHQRGDDCLQRIAGAMQASTYRATDVVARYGGEEFAILLPGVPLDIAMRVAERMRLEVSKLEIPHSASKVENVVTISVGVSSTEMNIGSPDALLREADTALYRAKKRGRNCVALPSDNTLINRL